MSWIAIVLAVGWLLVAVVLALLIGLGIRLADRRTHERADPPHAVIHLRRSRPSTASAPESRASTADVEQPPPPVVPAPRPPVRRRPRVRGEGRR